MKLNINLKQFIVKAIAGRNFGITAEAVLAYFARAIRSARRTFAKKNFPKKIFPDKNTNFSSHIFVNLS
jgi:amino acid transporter